MALKENRYGTLYAIDPHEQTDWNDSKAVNSFELAMDNISAVGVDEHFPSFVPFQMTPRAIGPCYRSDLIDGDHSYEGVKRDWEMFLPHVKPFGIVVLHDTMWICLLLKGKRARTWRAPLRRRVAQTRIPSLDHRSGLRSQLGTAGSGWAATASVKFGLNEAYLLMSYAAASGGATAS